MTDTLSIPAFRTVARVGAPSSYWVRGPVWDAVFMQNALRLLPLVLWLAHGRADPSRGPLDLLFFGITALFWIGHRFGSTWLVYATEAYRPLLKAQPFRFIAIPLLVAALCFAILLPADAALPWTRAQRVIALAIVDYVFSTWHFGAQHFGALSLYRGRAARRAGATACSRSARAGFLSSSPTCLRARSHTRSNGSARCPPGSRRNRIRSASSPPRS
jgi:hypothetical protein